MARTHRAEGDFQADFESETDFISYCILVAYYTKSMICLYSHSTICL